MRSYCIKEKKQTDCVPSSERYERARNGRLMLKCQCASCGITKTKFIKDTQEGGAIDLHKAIGRLPKPKRGFTLPSHHYTGPYNPLDEQLRYDPETGQILEYYQKPTGPTDTIASQHDVDYSVCKDDKKCKNKADRKMVKALDMVPFDQRQWGHWLARNAINTKQKLGLGVKKSKNGRGRWVRIKTGNSN